MVEVELGTHRCIPSILYLRGRAEYRRKTGGEQAGCQRNLGDPSASCAILTTYIILTTAVYTAIGDTTLYIHAPRILTTAIPIILAIPIRTADNASTYDTTHLVITVGSAERRHLQ